MSGQMERDMTEPAIQPDLLKCATLLSDDGDPVTSAVAFWVNEQDRGLGFVRNVNSKEDAQDLAKMLREHANTLDNWKPTDWKAFYAELEGAQ